jgi:hypothetical protein
MSSKVYIKCAAADVEMELNKVDQGFPRKL